jgi:C4-type Zn-finger protein
MPTEERQHAPTHLACPKCVKLMRLVAIEPSLSLQGYDEITYHCGNCNYKEKHVRKADNLPN